MAFTRSSALGAFLLCLAAISRLAGAQSDSNGQSSSGTISRIPGMQTAAGILASSSDGMSRYLAPDGPIQPALTAIGGLPMRGAELVNNGITSISSGFNSGAQSMSRAAGQNGEIRMPGMQAMESMMPESVANLGGMMQSAIRSKNDFIRGQAERGVAAGERLRNMFTNGFQGMQVRSSGGGSGGGYSSGGSSMGKGMGMGDMLSGASEAMGKGVEQIQNHLKESLSGTMGRMQQMHGIGENVRNQGQRLVRTVSSGIQGSVSQLQRTGEQAMSQLQDGLKQNMQGMGGILSSLQGSMSKSGMNMQGSMEGIAKQAQQAAQQAAGQIKSHIEQAAQMPMNMLQSLGGMMSGGKSGGGSGGRY